MDENLKNEIINHLRDAFNRDIKSVNSERYSFVDGTRLRVEKVRHEISSLLKFAHKKTMAEITDIIKEFEQSFILKKEKIEIKHNGEVSPATAEMLSAISNLRPAINVKDMKNSFLVNPITFERSDIDLDLYRSLTNKKMNEIILESIFVDTIYNPRIPDKFYDIVIDGVPVIALNTYKKPTWMSEDAEPEIPKIFKDFIDHLFINEKGKKYFYDWLYKSITDRAYTFLVLCGMKGIGKGQLQKLIRALHGRENFVEGKSGTISGQFNSQLENTRIIWFDEIRYDKS